MVFRPAEFALIPFPFLNNVSTLIRVFTPVQARLHLSCNGCSTIVAFGFILVAPNFNLAAALWTFNIFRLWSNKLRQSGTSGWVSFHYDYLLFSESYNII